MANSRNGKEDVVDTLLDAKICGAPRPDSAPKFTSNGGGSRYLHCRLRTQLNLKKPFKSKH